MCGIVGYIGNRPAFEILVKGLHRLEYRGYDSAGVALLNTDGDETVLNVYKTQGKVDDLERFCNQKDVNGNIGIAHTRWATHGEPNETNAHPHLSASGKIALVHNGTIENYNVLKEALQLHGRTFKSETDTEVLVQLIEYVKETTDCSLVDAVRGALKEVVGAYAIAVVDTDDPDTIIAARKSSPLVIGVGQNETFLASDATPIIEYTDQVVYLNDDEIAIIRRGENLTVINTDNEPLEVDIQTLQLSVSQLEKGGFPHFMLKEIYEQPKALRDTMTSRLDAAAKTIGFPELNWTAEELREINKIFIVACGTAYHAGIVGKYYLEQLARVPVEVDIASEFRYRDPLVDGNSLTIVISQSGETSDTLAALREAKRLGSRTLAVTNVVGSSIAREADQVVYTYAGPEIAVASTKAYTTQLLAMLMLAIYVGRLRGSMSAEREQELVRGLTFVPEQIHKMLENVDQIKVFAREYGSSEDAFFLGRSLDYAVALEGALKLKEISYIHAEAYAAGELKHGTLALIVSGVPVIVLATQMDVYDKTVSNLQEVKAREAVVIAIGFEGDTSLEKYADHVIYIPRTDKYLAPLMAVLPLQLLAYYAALTRGCDVDKPRNLAKSVTVE